MLEKLLRGLKGGPGSGNFGHAGRPGQIGGSGGAEGRASTEKTNKSIKNILSKHGFEATEISPGSRQVATVFKSKQPVLIKDIVSSLKRRYPDSVFDNKWRFSPKVIPSAFDISFQNLSDDKFKCSAIRLSVYKSDSDNTDKPKKNRGKMDVSSYKLLDSKGKEEMLRSHMASYKERYIPKEKQGKKLSSLSLKSQKTWSDLNSKIGQYEGMWRGTAKKGWSQKGKTRRKFFHAAVRLQDMASDLATARDALA